MSRIQKVIQTIKENRDMYFQIVTLVEKDWKEIIDLLQTTEGAYRDLIDLDMNEAAIALGDICEDDE